MEMRNEAAMKDRIRPRIADVIEIPTPKGLAYAHYTHKHEAPPRYGSLLRVFSGFHQERPSEFSAMVLQPPQFMTFFPLGAACNRGIVRIAGSEPVPSHAQAWPVFRNAMMGPNGHIVSDWWLWDGEKEWKIGKLAKGMEHYPPHGTINDTILIERIVNGWRHENFPARMC